MAVTRITPPLSDLASEIISALDELHEFTGFETFTWKEATIPCVANTVKRGISVAVGGYEIPIQFTLIVVRDDFLSADEIRVTADSELYTGDDDRPHPVAGRTLVFRGATYAILSASAAPGRGHYTLDLGDPNY